MILKVNIMLIIGFKSSIIKYKSKKGGLEMISLNQLVGTKIQKELNDIGWSQADLAEKLNTSRQIINKIVHGRKKITIEEIKDIADILNVNIKDLTTRTVKEEDTDPIMVFMGQVKTEDARNGLKHANQIMDLMIFHRDLNNKHQALFD
jgi:transcriptional regulator with XRE-family HTH domain